MALLFMDSFDHYLIADAPQKYTQMTAGSLPSSSTIGAGIGRHGSSGLRLGASNYGSYSHALFKVLAPADNTIIFGVALKCVTAFADLAQSNSPSALTPGAIASVLLLVRNGGTDQCWVRVDQTGLLSVLRGGTVIGTTSLPLTQNVSTYVEIKLTIHDSAGVIGIRFNGASVLNLTGQNTRAGTGNAWDEIRIGWVGSAGSPAATWDLDDLYLADGSGGAPENTFLGDVRVDACVPTAAGATTAWTPSAGANWQCVDDVTPNGDTDYNSTATVGAVDTFVVADSPVAAGTVYGVQAILSTRKEDVGAASVAAVVRHSGTNYQGSDLNPGVTYSGLMQLFATNPGTGAAWTMAQFNAAEFGYKRTA